MLKKVFKYLDLQVLGRILSYTKAYSKLFYATLTFTIILGFIAPVRPYLIKVMVDEFIPTKDTQKLVEYSILLVSILIAESIFQYVQYFLANLLGQNIIKDLRIQLYKKIINFKLSFFDKTPLGTLITRVVSDIETIAEVFSGGIIDIFGELLKIFVIVLAMFLINWQLAVLSLIPIPILIFATYLFKNEVKKAYQQVRTQVAALNTYVQEHLVGMSIVQVYNREENELKKFLKINAEHRDAHIKSIWAYSVFFPVVEILSALSISLLIWYGMRGVLQAEITFGDILLYIFFIFMLFRPIRQLADQFNVLQMGMVGAERVFKVIDQENAKIIDEGRIVKEGIEGDLIFKDVAFSYVENEPVLHGISFNIKKGQKVALVGATGSGKSTIANLIYRFYEFDKGEITLDGISIRDYSLSFLRSQMAMVSQDVFLFSDSILNNINLRDPNISREEVIDAAKKVGVHDFIMRLPGNYDYDVKERGGMLSKGQRQLISFLRAYVHNPGLLILDEATSSIDSETEILIQEVSEKLTHNRTSIIIAHRLSTIRNADMIIVMEKGRVIECGTHEELLKQDGHYKVLFEMQFKGENNS